MYFVSDIFKRVFKIDPSMGRLPISLSPSAQQPLRNAAQIRVSIVGHKMVIFSLLYLLQLLSGILIERLDFSEILVPVKLFYLLLFRLSCTLDHQR